jgi:hypothetical protein
MELEDMKKIWSRIEDNQVRKEYSPEEISAFRRARSRDFTSWIRTSLAFDLIMKLLVAFALVVAAILFRMQPSVFAICLITLILVLMMIPYVWSVRKAATRFDLADGTIQETLTEKIIFLKKMYYKVQFVQSLTNPMIVISGLLFYYYVSYGFVPPFHYTDWIVTLLLLLLSFILTLPATLSIYGFQLRNLQGSLSSLQDPDGYELETEKFRKRQRALSALLYGLLALGVAGLLLVMLL